MNILLIEPDVLSAKLYALALTKSGHSISIASTAQEALNRIDKKVPELIILELDIPAHNGLEFLYEFCTYSDWIGIPVVIHSSQHPDRFNKMLVSWKELNVVTYLYKPDTSLADLQQAASVALSKNI